MGFKMINLLSQIPLSWVINSKGEITMRLSRNDICRLQKDLLSNDGIKFNLKMKIDIGNYL